MNTTTSPVSAVESAPPVEPAARELLPAEKKIVVRRTAGGATGALVGAIVAGPLGAVVGGAIGVVVGGASATPAKRRKPARKVAAKAKKAARKLKAGSKARKARRVGRKAKKAARKVRR
jgi:hypothetical protein